MNIGRVTIGPSSQIKTIRIEGPTQTSITTREKQDQAITGTVTVDIGGTGLNEVSPNSLLIGNTATTLDTISSNNEGEVLVIGDNGKPEFSMIFGGTF